MGFIKKYSDFIFLAAFLVLTPLVGITAESNFDWAVFGGAVVATIDCLETVLGKITFSVEVEVTTDKDDK